VSATPTDERMRSLTHLHLRITWMATMNLSGVAAIILAGSEESQAA